VAGRAHRRGRRRGADCGVSTDRNLATGDRWSGVAGRRAARQRLRVALAAGLAFGLTFFYPLLSWEINVAWYVWVALATGEALIFAAVTIGQ
jgi:hypothetical protein